QPRPHGAAAARDRERLRGGQARGGARAAAGREAHHSTERVAAASTRSARVGTARTAAARRRTPRVWERRRHAGQTGTCWANAASTWVEVTGCPNCGTARVLPKPAES